MGATAPWRLSLALPIKTETTSTTRLTSWFDYFVKKRRSLLPHEIRHGDNQTLQYFDRSGVLRRFPVVSFRGGWVPVRRGGREYTEGHRKGQKAVCKWFKTGHVHEGTFFEQDIRAMEKGVELVQLWNQQNFIQNPIRVNVPEVWTFPRSDFFSTDTQVLVEPFIRNYQKFNSNSGWVSKPSPLTLRWPASIKGSE